jgi:hypothetical protein
VAPADPAQRQRLVAAVWRSTDDAKRPIGPGLRARLLRQLDPSVHGSASPVLEVPLPPRLGLDDGQVARIPAGTADLIAPGVRLRRGDPGLRRYLRHLDAEAPQLRRPSPLPFREVREAVLAPGHQLSLLVELQPVPDARRPTASAYREPAAGVLAPVGRVVIRAGTGRPTDPGARGR